MKDSAGEFGFFCFKRAMGYRETFSKGCYWVGVVLIVIAGCTVKNPVTDDAVSPVLSGLVSPDTLYLQTDVGYSVSVRVSDPQGWEDILVVRYFVYPEGISIPVWEDTLRDDGTGGDIVPRDGVFFDSVAVDFAGGTAGRYRIAVVAEDLAHHLSDTLSGSFTVVDDAKNFPPVLSSPVVPDTLTADSLADVFISIRAMDPQGVGDIDSVWVQVFPPLSPVFSFSGELLDDGTGGDEFGGDSVFSALVDLRMDPPVLSDLVAPDTVSRSAAEPIPLSVRVSDPQGLDDVKSVYFNTTKPDGTPASGNPFLMYDDGNEAHGDETAGDGIYSLLVTITSQNEKGVYRFDFVAEDYSWGLGECFFRFQAQDRKGLRSDAVVGEVVSVVEGAVSDTLTHTITVVD